MTVILFVCTGNVFRSLSAERALRGILPPDSGIHAESAGTHAWENHHLRADVRERLEHWGVDPSDHIPRPLSREIVENADLIVVLARGHRDHIAETYGRAAVLYNEIVHGVESDFPDLPDAIPDFRARPDEARAWIHEAVDTIFRNRETFLRRLPDFLPPQEPSGPAPPPRRDLPPFTLG